ncbi:hypothetical protein [Paenibacillus sp. yr247]|uniref:hypothetical protein n=1 Tax=Paenibacillus sp. yr247 TaxID=1761880 RepID=UPI000B821AD0|nr:hypothetical protein [Paenibacillus sp. yr247]
MTRMPGLLATETLSGSVSGVFNSFIFATKELMGTIMIISIIVAMSPVLIRTGINETMVLASSVRLISRNASMALDSGCRIQRYRKTSAGSISYCRYNGRKTYGIGVAYFPI